MPRWPHRALPPAPGDHRDRENRRQQRKAHAHRAAPANHQVRRRKQIRHIIKIIQHLITDFRPFIPAPHLLIIRLPRQMHYLPTARKPL